MRYEHFIKDPVHGYIGITELEKCFIDTYSFQRLRRILQLPTSVYVYPGATHTRFIHSIGSMHVADVFISSTLDKIALSKQEDRDSIRQFIRLVMLLHDVGHGPYSHTFEEAVLYNEGVNHEIMGSEILRKDPEAAMCLERFGKDLSFGVEEISRAIRSRSPSEWPLLRISGLEEDLEKSLYYIIKGSFSADIIDYLIRDSYYTGAGYGSGIDWVRIAYNTNLTRRGLAINEKALDALENLLISRYHMFMSVYYHKTSRAIDIMISEVLREAYEKKDLDPYLRDPLKYIELDEYSIYGIDTIRNHPYTRDLMKRKLRFASVEEYRLSLPRTIRLLRAILDKRYLNTLLRERLPRELSDKVFIDTPLLPLNPMFHSEEILIQRSDKSLFTRRIDQTTFGELSESVVIVRLYIDRDYLDKKEEAQRVFREILRVDEVRSFF